MKITSADIHIIDHSGPDTGHSAGIWCPVVLELHTDEGIDGLGEVALAYGTGSAAAVGMLQQMVGAFVIGRDPRYIEEIWSTLYNRTFWGKGGGPVVYGAISAIDMACWDITGRALGQPVHALLGGKVRDKIRLYANGWTYTDAQGQRRYPVRPEECAEAALGVVADGWDAFKLDPFMVRPDGQFEYSDRALARDRADLAYERVAAVRDAVGPDVEILVEVHGQLGPTSAIAMGRRLAELHPFFYEEPVDAMNVDVMAKVAAEVPIPIAAGERLYTRYGFREYVEKQAIDILQPDLGLAGGISEVRKIANHAEMYGLHVQPHNCAGPICTAASVQVDAGIPNFLIQEWFPYRDADHYAIVEEDLEHQAQDGYLTVPETPGLGVTLNHAYVARYPVAHVD